MGKHTLCMKEGVGSHGKEREYTGSTGVVVGDVSERTCTTKQKKGKHKPRARQSETGGARRSMDSWRASREARSRRLLQ